MFKYFLVPIILVSFVVPSPEIILAAAGDAFNLSQATIVGGSPADVANWPITTTLGVSFSSNDVSYNFNKKQGANRWPDYTPPGWDGPIYYTMWLFLNIDGKWVGSGFLQKYDTSGSGDPISDAPCNWYYDSRWAPMTGYKFKAGEQLGFMVTAGDARGVSSVTSVKERSNVIIMGAPTNADTCSSGSNPDPNPPGEPSEPTPPNPDPSGPAIITNITPISAVSGQEVRITGTNLANKVKLISSSGQETNITESSVDNRLIEIKFAVPLDIQPGQYTVTVTSSFGTVTSPTKLTVKVGGSQFNSSPGAITPPTQGLPTNLGQLIQQIFSWSLAVLGIAVFVMFFYAGFLWLTAAGNTARVGEARSRMTNAIFGAILLLSSYLILNTINPDFVKNSFNLPGLGKTTAPDSGGGGMIPCKPPEVISPDPMPVMQQVRGESAFSGLDLTDKTPGGGRDTFTTEVVKRLSASDNKWGRKKSSSGAPISTDSIGYLRPDAGSGRFEAVDTISGGGILQRGCYGVVGSSQVWVAP